MVGDIVFERPIAPETLRVALASVFGLEVSSVEVVSSTDDVRADATVSVAVEVVNGDFQWLVSIFAESKSLLPMMTIAKGLSLATGTRLLVGDDSVADPYAMLLVGPDTEPAPVALDVDSYERGEFRLASR